MPDSPAATVEATLTGERGFYDRYYGRFLDLPDEALRCDREHMERQLADPGHPIYERRRLYGETLRTLLALPLAGARVLDYGCGTGDWGVLLATEGAQVTLLDLSPVGIEVGLRRARVNGVADRVRGVARDASDLACFADRAFDLVFANAAIHHTLKYGDAARELARIVEPGGVVVLAETFGNNPALNLARRIRARLAREPAEQGEGIILDDDDLARLAPDFEIVSRRPLNLVAMAKRLARGRFTWTPVRGTISALERLDAVLLRVWPGLSRYCGELVVVARRVG